MDVALPLFQRYAIAHFIEAGTLTGLLALRARAICRVILVQALSVVVFARNSMNIEMYLGRDLQA